MRFPTTESDYQEAQVRHQASRGFGRGVDSQRRGKGKLDAG